MNNQIISVYTQPNCPKSPETLEYARSIARESGAQVEEIDITTINGLFNAVNYDVNATPTVIIRSKDSFKKLSSEDKQSIISAMGNYSM